MRPGRPRCPRRIENEPDVTYFKPRGIPLKELEVIVLSIEELETVRLVDLEGMEQEQAAQKMGISRRAFWEDLQAARRKITGALVDGKAIEIKGGSYMVEAERKFKCCDCGLVMVLPERPDNCVTCGGSDIVREGWKRYSDKKERSRLDGWKRGKEHESRRSES